MAKPHGLSTLIEAARFIEVGESQSISQDSSINADEASGKEESATSSESAQRPKKGCLRRELQATNPGSLRSRACHSEEVRQDHNRMEKMRRRDMRKEFEDLKNRIPSLQKGKHSSVAVLQSAVEYIGELKELERSLKSKQQLLYDQHRSLSLQLATLQQTHRPCSCSQRDKADNCDVPEPCVNNNKAEEIDVEVRRRKRTESDSSTISADSPKAFIGNRDEDISNMGDDKFIALCEKQCRNSAICLSPPLSASNASSSSCLTVSTSAHLNPSSSSNVSPNSETNSLSIDHTGLMSPPESITSSVSRVSSRSKTISTSSNATRTSSPALSVKDSDGQKTPTPVANLKPQSNNLTAKDPRFRSPKELVPIGKVFQLPAKPLTAVSTPVRAISEKIASATTPAKPINRPAVVVGKQLAATFASDRLAGMKRKATSQVLNDNTKVMRQQVTSSPSVNFPASPCTPVRLQPIQAKMQPVVQVPAEKQVTVAKKVEQTTPRRICVVASGSTTATVTPITIVTAQPVKPAQYVFLQPVESTKLCQPVVLLPAPTNQVAMPSKTFTIVSNRTAGQSPQTQIVRRVVPVSATSLVHSGSSESQTSRASGASSQIVLLHSSSTPPSSIKHSTTTTATPTNPAVISVLSPPATPNGVFYSSAGQSQP